MAAGTETEEFEVCIESTPSNSGGAAEGSAANPTAALSSLSSLSSLNSSGPNPTSAEQQRSRGSACFSPRLSVSSSLAKREFALLPAAAPHLQPPVVAGQKWLAWGSLGKVAALSGAACPGVSGGLGVSSPSLGSGGRLRTLSEESSPVAAYSTDASPASRCANSCCSSPSQRLSPTPAAEASLAIGGGQRRQQLSLPPSREAANSSEEAEQEHSQEMPGPPDRQQSRRRSASAASVASPDEETEERDSADDETLCAGPRLSARPPSSASDVTRSKNGSVGNCVAEGLKGDLKGKLRLRAAGDLGGEEGAASFSSSICITPDHRVSLPREETVVGRSCSPPRSTATFEEGGEREFPSGVDEEEGLAPSSVASSDSAGESCEEAAAHSSSPTDSLAAAPLADGLQTGVESDSDGWTPVESRRLRRWADMSLSDDEDLPFQRPELQTAVRRKRKVPLTTRTSHPHPHPLHPPQTPPHQQPHHHQQQTPFFSAGGSGKYRAQQQQQAPLVFFHSALTSALVESNARLNVLPDHRIQRSLHANGSAAAAEGQRRRCTYTANANGGVGGGTVGKTAGTGPAVFGRAKWVFWHDACGNLGPQSKVPSSRPRGQDNYGQGIRQIALLEFPSQVEGVLKVLTPNSLKPPANLSACVVGVSPLWEDVANRQGGHFALRSFASRTEAQEVFSGLLKELEFMQRPTPHTHRPRAPVHVWVKPAHPNVLRQLETWMTGVLQVLKPSSRLDVDFLSHEECLAKNKQRLRPPTRSARSSVQTSPSVCAESSPQSPRLSPSNGGKSFDQQQQQRLACKNPSGVRSPALSSSLLPSADGSFSETSPSCGASSTPLIEGAGALLSERKVAELDSAGEGDADEPHSSARGSRLSCSSLETAPSYKSVILRGTQNSANALSSAHQHHRDSFASSTSSSCAAPKQSVAASGVCTPQGAMWDSPSRDCLEEVPSPAAPTSRSPYLAAGEGEIGEEEEREISKRTHSGCLSQEQQPDSASAAFCGGGAARMPSFSKLPPTELSKGERDFSEADGAVLDTPLSRATAATTTPPTTAPPPPPPQCAPAHLQTSGFAARALPPRAPPQVFVLQPPVQQQQFAPPNGALHHHHHHHHQHHHQPHHHHPQQHHHHHQPHHHYHQHHHQPHHHHHSHRQQLPHAPRRFGAASAGAGQTPRSGGVVREFAFEEASNFPTPAEAAAASAAAASSAAAPLVVGLQLPEDLRRQGGGKSASGLEASCGFPETPRSVSSNRGCGDRKNGRFGEQRGTGGGRLFASGAGGFSRVVPSNNGNSQQAETEAEAGGWGATGGFGERGLAAPPGFVSPFTRAPSAAEQQQPSLAADVLFEHLSCFNPTALPDYFSMQQAAYQGRLAAAADGAAGEDARRETEGALLLHSLHHHQQQQQQQHFRQGWTSALPESLCCSAALEAEVSSLGNLFLVGVDGQGKASPSEETQEAAAAACLAEAAFEDEMDASSLLLLSLLFSPFLEVPAPPSSDCRQEESLNGAGAEGRSSDLRPQDFLRVPPELPAKTHSAASCQGPRGFDDQQKREIAAFGNSI